MGVFLVLVVKLDNEGEMDFFDFCLCRSLGFLKDVIVSMFVVLRDYNKLWWWGLFIKYMCVVWDFYYINKMCIFRSYVVILLVLGLGYIWGKRKYGIMS